MTTDDTASTLDTPEFVYALVLPELMLTPRVVCVTPFIFPRQHNIKERRGCRFAVYLFTEAKPWMKTDASVVPLQRSSVLLPVADVSVSIEVMN